jgi:hypothetical protein
VGRRRRGTDAVHQKKRREKKKLAAFGKQYTVGPLTALFLVPAAFFLRLVTLGLRCPTAPAASPEAWSLAAVAME